MDPTTNVLIGGQQLFGYLEAVVWTALRVGGLFMVGPLFGTRVLPARIRLIFVLALSVVLAPLLPAPPRAALDAATMLNVIREMAVGVALGFLLRICFEAAALAGELIAQGMALAFAQMADPLRGGATSGVVGLWFYIAFVFLFLAFDGHLAMIRLLHESYGALPVGGTLANPSAFVAAIPDFFARVLLTGVSIALPVMVAMLAINLAFGVLGRAAPTLNPIAVGIPLALVVGMFLMMLVLTELEDPVRRLFDAAFTLARGLLH